MDVAVSSMTDTAERQLKADFVNYFSAETSIVVRRGNPQGILELGDLCGRRVAVEQGTVQVDMLEHSQRRCGARPVELLASPDNAQALLKLRTRRADALLSDYPPAAELANGTRTRAHYQLAPTRSTSRACTAPPSPRTARACATRSTAPWSG